MADDNNHNSEMGDNTQPNLSGQSAEEALHSAMMADEASKLDNINADANRKELDAANKIAAAVKQTRTNEQRKLTESSKSALTAAKAKVDYDTKAAIADDATGVDKRVAEKNAQDAKNKATTAAILAKEEADSAERQANKDASTAESARQSAAAAAIAAELAANKAAEVAAEKAAADAVIEDARKAAEKVKGIRTSGTPPVLTKAQRERNARIKRLKDGGVVVVNGYGLPNLSDRVKLLNEEAARRVYENERQKAIDASISAELAIRAEFDAYAKMLQTEFDLLMQKDYPWFVGERNITQSERAQKEAEVEIERKRLQIAAQRRRALHRKKFDAELARKAAEAQFKISRLRDDEAQEFFEEVVSDDAAELQEENLDNMTEMERAIKEKIDIENKIGRKIIPHRDIIESTDSDFDPESQLNPDDILIRDDRETDIGQTEERQLELLQLQKSMESDGGDDEFYITGKSKAAGINAALNSEFTVTINEDDDTPYSNRFNLNESLQFVQSKFLSPAERSLYYSHNQIGRGRQVELELLDDVLGNPSILIPQTEKYRNLINELKQLRRMLGI
jgi:hypothetical protein